MNKLYWSYETAIGDTTNISVRSNGPCDKNQYFNYLVKIICAASGRIISATYPVIFADGSRSTIIHLSGRDEFYFGPK